MPAPCSLAVLAAAVSVSLALAACTSGSTPSPSPSSVVTRTTTPTPAVTTPVSTGPTTAATVASCPFAGKTFVQDTVGLRLAKVTVLTVSAGRVVGCRFYPLTHPNAQCDATCLNGERLPGPNQPAVEITTQRYASAVAAHNAFVRRAGTSASVTQVDFTGTTGLCFQDDFDPQDKGADYACTVNKGPVMVLVRTVDTTQTTGATAILNRALSAVTQ